MTDAIALTPLPANFLPRVAGTVPGSKRAHQQAIIAAISPILTQTMNQFSIDNDYRVCHFIGQCCEESDSFCTTEEYASGAAYEGRRDLGNTHPGDGRRFKGRGLFMLTGRANYLAVGAALHLDLVGHPEAAAEPANALLIACFYWQQHGLSAFADQDDITTITKRINGGLNGFSVRKAMVDRAFVALGYV